MKSNFLGIFVLANLVLIFSCAEKAKKENAKDELMAEEMVAEPVYDTNNLTSVFAAMEYAHGGWDDLYSKKDVQYTYRYHSPAANKTDLSTERYIFSNEASYGKYTQHEINVMPDKEGVVEQHFDGSATKVMVDGEVNEDPQNIGMGEFLRRANFFWFVMPYKLNDSGTISEYIGQEDFEGKIYDKVLVTYDPAVTGKEQNDTYILFIDPETKMASRFLFSLPALGVNEPILIANYDYTNVGGQMIATKRTYFLPNEKGEFSEEPSLVQTLTDISFNNGFTVENIME
ncbi:DUF6503 family protein [Croceivirga thetidis]|uniref:Outer membrane lipoprotein-sorting protein n=1 Tax=Croceivirga thetidis TaxID=2721623 RepID=A0ABX1GSZ1_9FLAO|nr:DUF6503 family protein [Croceivirga thetidis]NKI33077.1 hypothetical protein [Croceivirga thetidis]